MFSRLIGFVLLITTVYVLLVFALPNVADQYGDKDINTKIRNFKNQSLQFASGSDSATSLFQKIQGTTTTYIDKTKQDIQVLESTVKTKVNQVQEASKAVESAYSGVVDAKQKIQALTGTGK